MPGVKPPYQRCAEYNCLTSVRTALVNNFKSTRNARFPLMTWYNHNPAMRTASFKMQRELASRKQLKDNFQHRFISRFHLNEQHISKNFGPYITIRKVPDIPSFEGHLPQFRNRIQHGIWLPIVFHIRRVRPAFKLFLSRRCYFSHPWVSIDVDVQTTTFIWQKRLQVHFLVLEFLSL